MEAASNYVTAYRFFCNHLQRLHIGEGRYFIYEVTCDQAIFLPFGAVFKVQGPLQLF